MQICAFYAGCFRSAARGSPRSGRAARASCWWGGKELHSTHGVHPATPDANRHIFRLSNDQRHGKGTFTWANGKVFEGEWTHGEATYKGDDAPPPQTSPVKRTTKVAPGNFGATMGPGSPGTTK